MGPGNVKRPTTMVPDHFKTEEMCNQTVENNPYRMRFIPVHFRTQEMCIKAIEKYLYPLIFVSDHLKTEKMCNEAVEKYGGTFGYVPDCFKTDEMYERAVENGLCNLKFILDWFVTQQQIKSWHDRDNYWDDDDIFFKWYHGYKKRKTQKAQSKKELMPIAWHPSRWWDWCVPEDEKKETEKLWG